MKRIKSSHQKAKFVLIDGCPQLVSLQMLQAVGGYISRWCKIWQVVTETKGTYSGLRKEIPGLRIGVMDVKIPQWKSRLASADLDGW